MTRRHLFAAVPFALVVVSCGGGSISQPEWKTEAAWSEPVNGLALSLQSGLDQYPQGTPVYLKVGFKNTERKSRYLDARGGYKCLTLEITGPDRKVTPGAGKGGSDTGSFVKLEPGETLQVDVTGPATANWSYDLSAPGSYTVTAVFEGSETEDWLRQSVAGGKYEGEVLFIGTVKSPPVTFEVLAPSAKK